MTTIDRFNTVGAAPNVQEAQPLPDTVSVKSKQAQGTAAPGADDLDYLKTTGKAPVPPFAGPAQADTEQHGKAALRVMHRHVRADANRLASAWRGDGGINYSMLIEVLVKLDSEQAKESREAHTWEYKQVAATHMKAASDERKAGHMEFIGVMVSSSATMAAGAAQIGSSGAAMAGEGGGGSGTAEVSGESAAEEPAVPLEEEEETSTPVGEPMETDATMETEETTAASSEQDSVEDTADVEAEVEGAAAEAQSGDAGEDAGEVTEEDRGRAQSRRKEQGAIDDDTKKMMRQFGKDTKAQVASQRSQVKLNIGSGLAQGMQGLGSAGKGVADLAASDLRAKGKEEEATAAEQTAVMQREADFGKSCEENAKKMMDVYDAIAQSRNASMERAMTA